MGGVFSPFYRRARRRVERGRGRADPMAHCGVNVALYGEQGGHWAYSEYRADRVERTATELKIGHNRLCWEGDRLRLEVDERTAPWRRPLRGTVHLHAPQRHAMEVRLDPRGKHRWYPVAPRARVEARFECPRGWRLEGSGYSDANWGDEALVRGFRDWQWSRAELEDGSAVLYDVRTREGELLPRGWHFGADGAVETLSAPQRHDLGRSRWGLERRIRSDAAEGSHLVRSLEDTPFYSRALVQSSIASQSVLAMHESLCMERFEARHVQWMLPFRMRRPR